MTGACGLHSASDLATRRGFLWWAAGAAALAAGCSNNAAPRSLSSHARPDLVGRYASANPGSVNTYWLQVPHGLVVIDTQRTLSDAHRAVSHIRRTGKPVLAILLTHSHPDHVSGTAVFRAAFRSAPVYASEATAEVMRTDPLGFYALTRRQLGADYPRAITLPDRTFGSAATLSVGGARLETAQFGPGESETATVYHQRDTGVLFCGDLAANHMTPALIEGHSGGWLTNLSRLRGVFPHVQSLYPGHGDPGRPAPLIRQQQIYLHRFRNLVQSAVSLSSPGGRKVSLGEQRAILSQMNRWYPGYPRVASLPTLPELNVAAVARELATQTTANMGQSPSSSCCGTE